MRLHRDARRAAALVALAVVIAAVPFVASSCRTATHVQLELSTDVGCDAVRASSGVEIHLGGAFEAIRGDASSPATVTSQCEGPGTIGSLVLVPSGADNGRVVVETRLPLRPGPCVEGQGCIVARRALAYVPHTKLALPIRLRAACANVVCGPQETCVDGACRSAEVNLALCTDGVCDEGSVGVDAGVPDAGPRDASQDSGCGPLPRAMCGAVCVDTSKDPAHCGGCGVDCSQGECTGGLCRLVPTLLRPSDPNDRGCLALDPGTTAIYWTSNRADAGHVFRVPRTGGTATLMDPMAVPLYRAGGIGAGGGRISFGAQTGVIPAPTGYLYESTPPAAFTGSFYAGPASDVPSVARDAVDTCSITGLADGGTAVYCNGNYKVPLSNPASSTTIAVSQGRWAAAAPVGSINLYTGAISAGVTGISRAGAVGIAALPGTSTFFVAAGSSALRVDMAMSSVIVVGTWPLPAAVGVAVDPLTSEPWILDRPSNMAGRAVRLEPDGGTRLGPSVSMPATPTPVCLAVDDQALYFLSGGVPYKLAK
jgi:hypothetical protein